jgi:hypothetical protein
MSKFHGRPWTLQSNVDWHEKYQKDVEAFVGVIKQNSNHIHFAWILATFWTTQIEAKLTRMQEKYHENGRFQSHHDRNFRKTRTSWHRIFEMFPENLPKMQENSSIDWATHLELNWEYFTTMFEKIGELLWPTS